MPNKKKDTKIKAQSGYIIPEQQIYAQQMNAQLQMGLQQPYPLPVNQNMQAQPIPQSQFPNIDYSQASYQSPDTNSGSNLGSVAGGIGSGVKAIGGVLDTIGDIRRGIITGGSALLNALIPDNQQPRPKAIQYTNSQDPYGNQTYNNMYEMGGSININPAHKGLFTAKADEHNMSVQEYARYVLSHKDDFNTQTEKQAQFAHNFSGGKAQNGATVTNYAYGQDIPNLTPIQQAVLNGTAQPTSMQDVTPNYQPIPLPINNGSQYDYYNQGQNGQFTMNIPRFLQDRTAMSGSIGDPYSFSTNRSFGYENQYGNRDYTPQQYQTSDYYGRVFQNGGIVNNSGYLDGSPTANNPVNVIPTNYITTQGMSQPINANGQTLMPNTGNYLFPTQSVTESQIYQAGKEYDLSEEDMKKLKSLGYEFE